MKKYFLIGSVAFLLASCKSQPEEQSNVNRERDSLMAIINERDSALTEFVSTMNEVETNLTAVAVKQNMVSASADNKNEFKTTPKDRINSEIEAINNLMDQNRKKIADLNKKLKNANGKNEQLQKMIATLNDQLVQKDKELAELNEKLNGLNAEVAQLQTTVNTQNETITSQKSSMHTAYYVIGKSKDLQTAKIIDRTGGLLGIGRTSKLSSHFDNSKFTRIDDRQISSIAVGSKSAKIITTHPADSYTLEKDKSGVIQNILISDADKFWSASKYLVVIKD